MKAILDFNYRIGNIEARSCNGNLMEKRPHITAEIIEWKKDKESCCTIAYWKEDKEGYSLKFVGSRPIQPTIDFVNFFKLIKIGQMMLDNYYELGRME